MYAWIYRFVSCFVLLAIIMHALCIVLCCVVCVVFQRASSNLTWSFEGPCIAAFSLFKGAMEPYMFP